MHFMKGWSVSFISSQHSCYTDSPQPNPTPSYPRSTSPPLNSRQWCGLHNVMDHSQALILAQMHLCVNSVSIHSWASPGRQRRWNAQSGLLSSASVLHVIKGALGGAGPLGTSRSRQDKRGLFPVVLTFPYKWDLLTLSIWSQAFMEIRIFLDLFCLWLWYVFIHVHFKTW